MNINKDIKFTFEQHDFHVEEVDGVLKVSLKDEVFIDTNLTQREDDESITSKSVSYTHLTLPTKRIV